MFEVKQIKQNCVSVWNEGYRDKRWFYYANNSCNCSFLSHFFFQWAPNVNFHSFDQSTEWFYICFLLCLQISIKLIEFYAYRDRSIVFDVNLNIYTDTHTYTCNQTEVLLSIFIEMQINAKIQWFEFWTIEFISNKCHAQIDRMNVLRLLSICCYGLYYGDLVLSLIVTVYTANKSISVAVYTMPKDKQKNANVFFFIWNFCTKCVRVEPIKNDLRNATCRQEMCIDPHFCFFLATIAKIRMMLFKIGAQYPKRI